MKDKLILEKDIEDARRALDNFEAILYDAQTARDIALEELEMLEEELETFPNEL